MRLTCPLCGARDRREFSYAGAALERPEGAGWDDRWHAYLHLRENPAGWRRERWFHEAGCGAWIEVERHTTSHAIRAAWLSAQGGGPDGAEPARARATGAPRDAGDAPGLGGGAFGGRGGGGREGGGPRGRDEGAPADPAPGKAGAAGAR